MIKLNIERYYNNVSLQYKYTHIPVIDKRDNLVEITYTVSKGNKCLYTLNMYHTKCSYLVNGKNSQHCVTNIVSDIMRDLQNQGTPVSEINNATRDMLQRANKTDIKQESITECKAIDSEDYEIVHDTREVYKECRSTESVVSVLQICFADNDSSILDLTSDNTCIKTVYSDGQDSSNSEVKETYGNAKCIAV